LFEARERETKLGSLGFFLSGEREVLENLRVRGGVRGLATFRDVEDTRNLITVDYDSYRTTGTFTAGIDSPDFFLGTGYRWKSLTFDVRLRESIDLDSPFLHWSVGMRF
jgi:hypothetical protein